MTTKYERDLGLKEENIFSIRNKGLKFDSANDIKEYIEQIENLKLCYKIDISGNTISPECSQLLANAMKKHKETIKDVNFQDIYVSRDRFEIPASLDFFFPVLLEMPQLSVLNLSDNAFGQDTITQLEGFISEMTVEHLILSNNGLGPLSGARIGKALFKNAKIRKFKNAQSLKSFWCGRNRLENGSCDALSLGFKAHSQLEEIKLYQNGIRPKGLSTLITFGLSSLSELKVLDLQDNTMTSSGSLALANALQGWKNLIELNLNDCLLKPKGSLQVVQALGRLENSNLQVLRLQYNELEEDSLDVLSHVVINLNQLSTLELNGNRFDEDSHSLAKINDLFEERGLGEVDELDDLEELDSEEEEEDSDEEDNEVADDDDQVKQRLEKLTLELASVAI
ncbi:GTPase-activating protein [Martiniozyma asiatica (nom. inval.)]|nr:GTPase-activating protein [Martiniozyma asiatica]